MAAELGINVRVWIGTIPGSPTPASYPAGCTGTITDGPIKEGDLILKDDGAIFAGERGWVVDVDNDLDSGGWAIAEISLFPLDDGEPESTEKNRKAPTDRPVEG